jgi:hypothetical protein
VTALCLIASVSAFSRQPSAFTGREVCSKAELTTELSCPPSSSLGGMRRGNTLSMPPFLKKLGLKKPEKPVAGGASQAYLDQLGDKTGEANTSVSIMEKTDEETKANDAALIVDEECVIEEELSESQKLMKQVKEAGTAGVISYAIWELGFWALSVPVCVVGYQQVTGHWPDLSDAEDQKKLGAEAFAFVNFARFAVPLRIGLALGTTPWIQENVVDRFMKKDDNCEPQ